MWWRRGGVLWLLWWVAAVGGGTTAMGGATGSSPSGTYAELGRFLTPDGKDTSDEAAAAKTPEGRPVENGLRNMWVTETALTTALNMSYMAEQLSDRVTRIITLNELYIFVEMGHRGLEIDVGGGTGCVGAHASDGTDRGGRSQPF